jgi:hypothetical protein
MSMLSRIALIAASALLLVLMVGCKPNAYGASWDGLPREQAQSKLITGEYQTSPSASSMPAGLQDAFRRATRQLNFELADPDATGENVPERKLIFWGSGPQNSFVHYQQGRDTKMLVFAKHDSTFEFVWGGQGTRTAADVQELKRLISSNEFKDDQPYWW